MPNHQLWYAKWKLSRNMVHVAYVQGFCTFGSDLHARLVLIDKISALGAQSGAYQECVVGWVLLVEDTGTECQDTVHQGRVPHIYSNPPSRTRTSPCIPKEEKWKLSKYYYYAATHTCVWHGGGRVATVKL